MSPLMWDDSTDDRVIFDPTCCDQPMNDTGCDAPSCRGYVCDECCHGCDIEAGRAGEGRCALELAAESDEGRAERVDRERAAFGLPSLPTRESAPAPAPDPHVSYVPGEDPQTAALREMVNANRKLLGIDGDVRGGER